MSMLGDFTDAQIHHDIETRHTGEESYTMPRSISVTRVYEHVNEQNPTAEHDDVWEYYFNTLLGPKSGCIEGVDWIRGHFESNGPEERALLTAYALYRGAA